MNYTVDRARATNFPTFIEKVRLMMGMVMMIAGLYFGVSSVGVGESLGFLSFLASPFVMLSDK